ncbi:selenoprotein L isoform X1 [Narcine bancroftii]|uniref:selenoprotein L isoform X1 n=1 Tax=Narcine bancroftii TaxID=1343680 RepID=UPI003831A0AC
MEEAVPAAGQELLRALEELSQGGQEILASARAESSGELFKSFISQKIGRLAGLIQLYANFFNNLHLKKRSDAEDLFKKFYHFSSVREQVEDLMEFELEWNNFLGDVDGQMKTSTICAELSLGSQVPGCLVFTDVRNGREVQLREFLEGQEKLLLVLLRHFA